MFSGNEIVDVFRSLGVTHVVYLPDSTLGLWEPALAAAADMQLVRVCREGEAWAIAAGLHIGGRRPIVVLQSTGLFESGDALRNVLYDLGLPLWAVIGYRSYLLAESKDSAKCFAEPILQAWSLEYLLIERREQLPQIAEHLQTSAAANRPGIVLLAEGKG
ncbi:MAG: thiamine pyrophosphate-binding protein [Pirellulales bacterium]